MRYTVCRTPVYRDWIVFDSVSGPFDAGRRVAAFAEFYPESEQRARTLCDFLNEREAATNALAGEATP